MFATVRRYTVAPGSAAKFSPRIESEFLPHIQSISGFVSYTLTEGEPENGRDVVVTISVFQTQAGAEESVRRAATWVRAELAEFEPSAPQVTSGNVLLMTTAAPSSEHSRGEQWVVTNNP